MTTATHTTENLKPILDKIARLKNLAAQPGTPEEAAAALAAIGRLVARHNLSEAQVEMADRDEEQGYHRHDLDLGGNNGWRTDLFCYLARYMFCEPLIDSRGSGAYLVGKRENIVVVTGLYTYLVDTVLRLADEGWDELDPIEKRCSTVRRWKNAFKVGAVHALGQRLQNQRREHVAEYEGGSALVVVQEAELKQAVTQFFGKVRRSSQSSGYSDASAHAAGRKAGAGINLAAQLGG